MQIFKFKNINVRTNFVGNHAFCCKTPRFCSAYYLDHDANLRSGFSSACLAEGLPSRYPQKSTSSKSSFSGCVFVLEGVLSSSKIGTEETGQAIAASRTI